MKELNILCLFDKSGIMGRDWADAGHNVVCMDWEADAGVYNGIIFVCFDLTFTDELIEFCDNMAPDVIFSFPDCTHLAVSGAKHFEKKRQKDPDFQKKAIKLFRTGEDLAERYDIPGFTENPISVAATMYRKPDAYFHPYEYGGYLPEDDAHPQWPEYIAARDAYPKLTAAWLKNGFTLPPKKPVQVNPGYSTQFKKLGGKSKKTKDIRSLTPRGFARAVFEHMEPQLRG